MTATLERQGNERQGNENSPIPLPSLQWPAHPLIDTVDGGKHRRLNPAEIEEMIESLGLDALLKYHAAACQRIKAAETDPLRAGFELPTWPIIREQLHAKDELYLFSANDAGKSEFGGKWVNEVLTRRFTWPTMMPGPPKVLCIAQNDAASKLQMEKVHKYAPLYARAANEKKGKPRNPYFKYNWSQAEGFTGAKFVLPNPKGAECDFRTVAQWLKGELSFESFAFHAVWIDEDAPLGMWDALRFRAAKKQGKLLFTFTPVSGFSGVCKTVLNGARIVESLPMQWEWV